MAYVGQWEFLEVGFSGFLQIGNSLFDRQTLACRANFRALGDVEAALSVQDCGESCGLAYGNILVTTSVEAKPRIA